MSSPWGKPAVCPYVEWYRVCRSSYDHLNPGDLPKRGGKAWAFSLIHWLVVEENPSWKTKGLKFGEDEPRWLNTSHEVSILFLMCVSRIQGWCQSLPWQIRAYLLKGRFAGFGASIILLHSPCERGFCMWIWRVILIVPGHWCSDVCLAVHAKHPVY